jgi:hypothetical protein
MEKVSQEALNSAFSEMLDSPDETRTLTEAGVTHIKQRLREESFARKIIPPQNVTKYDCQRSVDSDTVEKIVDLEPLSTAMALNFRSNAPANLVEGTRYRIPFFKVETMLYEKGEEELLAYDMPVVKIIEDNSVKDIQEAEDGTFLTYSNVAVGATGQVLQITGTNVLSDKRMLTEAFKLLDGGAPTAATANKLHTATLLMNAVTFDDLLGMPNEQFGTPLTSEVVKDGYAYKQILGKKLIITTKNDLVPYGVVWLFAEQKFLGNFFILNNTKFWIEKKANMIRWKTWEVVGLGIGNIKGIAKLEFGSGITTPSANAVRRTIAEIT